eukprot:3971959-Pleurochrysis_carterae.AAC.1
MCIRDSCDTAYTTVTITSLPYCVKVFQVTVSIRQLCDEHSPRTSMPAPKGYEYLKRRCSAMLLNSSEASRSCEMVPDYPDRMQNGYKCVQT